MSNVYTLDDLRASLEKKYAPVEIDGVVLRNVMRLSKDERKTVLDAVAQVNNDGDEQESRDLDVLLDHIKTVITVVGEGTKGAGLAKKVGDDLALGMEILRIWSEATQPGEAQNSPS